jgi:hypothetical protein
VLGIALAVLLGFFLCHYRPKDLDIEFEQSLHWSEFGKGCFICQSIFLLALQYAYFILSVLTGNTFRVENRNMLLFPFDCLDPYSIAANAFLYGFPVVSAWLTHKKLIESLSEEKVPRQNLFHLMALSSLMSVIGFFSVYLIQLLAMGFGYGVVLEFFLSNLSIFSILLIGVFAVEMAEHKLKAQLTI